MASTVINLSLLEDAVAGQYAAIRSITRLQPAGGAGDKVFPPTYVKEGRSTTKYAVENRKIDGREVMTVLLDSVPSQANRMEEALLDGWRRGELNVFPLIEVDFSEYEDLADLDRLTSLQTPHRIADALLRDSVDHDGVPFRQTDYGRAFSESRTNHATGMFRTCPTALIFGCWDSTGPKGGLGSKFQRCVVSEIVGYDVVFGVKTASRIDPTGIERKAGTVYESKSDPNEWTTIIAEAAVDAKGNPKLFSRKGAGDKGTPAVINHGNIPPSIDAEAGGVTIDHAIQTTVLSLPGLRRLRFQTDVKGQRLDDSARPAAELAARTALAALALAAIVYLRENDYDLRSRALLVPTEPLVFQFVGRDGLVEEYTLDREGAVALLREAARKAEAAGMGWTPGPLSLKPSPKLARLIQVSRSTVAGAE
ncbi:MAG: type I-G CRISPR-associated RAMP protein Csb1/Cas7g [Candidatus Xenobium sp.]|jgi:CRISPR-associated protein Csb1|nr:type I-U CRISPR-associated protein Cas7 [Burkholderiales bacterium]